jgi:hypothetical protein
MNWGLFALSVSALLVVPWIYLLTRREWSWPGLIVSVGSLLVAVFNSAAPFRGAIDPDYVGFGFGLLQADKGIAVSLLAGPLLLFGAISAFLAVSRTHGAALWLVAAFSAALLIILGVPIMQGMFADPEANAIQFGEYLTIPGLFASAIYLLLLVPFIVGLLWAPRAAMRPAN